MDKLIIKNNKELKHLTTLAMLAGKIMLSNGGEVYRVEDTINRICNSYDNIREVDSYVINTGVFLTLEYKGEIFTYFKRGDRVSINLAKIKLVNDFSRRFVNEQISLNEGIDILREINKSTGYSNYLKIFGASFASAFFSLMFGGDIRDFFSSFIASLTALIILNYFSKFKLPFFIETFVGAFFTSLFATYTVKLGLGTNLDTIIIASIMFLVPGVAITNSIRDTMAGDFLTGQSKGIEAIISAFAIASGVGIVLNLKAKGLI